MLTPHDDRPTRVWEDLQQAANTDVPPPTEPYGDDIEGMTMEQIDAVIRNWEKETQERNDRRETRPTRGLD